MWIVYAILVHLALLGSIFVIYFRSPVITGLNPQKELQNPPADRLVLIVLDGLRAESFFRNECKDVPHIFKLILERGLVGISHTRVPTESRPGHIALIAGLYEDPSAVLRGWKTNPIDFDNVFNRSSHTYAWGAMDVLHIFSKITGEDRLMIDAYNEYDFTGKDTPFLVDQWVFDRVNSFLNRKAADLKAQKRVIFFLHLLALDTSGHIHKPGSKLFLETLHNTEKGVYDIYKRFEETFPDGKTAYVLTSDHGMTNHGSHGAGEDFETETPFVIWGAGANNWNSTPESSKNIKSDAFTIPLAFMQQAQMAPLMSALVGIAPPMNNFGMLPPLTLNVSEEYAAHATYTNALQIIAQFESLLNQFNRGYLSSILNTCSYLDAKYIRDFRKRSEKFFQSKEYDILITHSYYIMSKALSGIEYFLNYYQYVLLICTSLTFLLWMLYLIASLSEDFNKPKNRTNNFRGPKVTALLLTVFTIVQRVPLEVSFYMLLPVVLWVLCLYSFPDSDRFRNTRRLLRAREIVVVMIASVLMVCSFFQEKFITLVFLLFCAFKFKDLKDQGLKFYVWCILTAILSGFPFLPGVVGNRNDLLLFLGAVLAVGRALLVKSGVSKKMFLIAILGLLNAAFCIYKHNNHNAVPLVFRVVSWLFLLRSLVVSFYSAPNTRKIKVERIFFYLSTAYLLLSTSYEAIFVVLLGSQLMLTFSQSTQSPVNYMDFKGTENLTESFQQALGILIYTLFAIFGTGNTASVSSFDPNVMRCFITTFSPWIIMGLVVLKLFLPVLLNMVIIYGTLGPALNERKVFIAMLVICDFMGLILLFCVKNHGSWLEIGSSISRFVIMIMMTLILVGTTYIVKLYLRRAKTSESVCEMEKIK